MMDRIYLLDFLNRVVKGTMTHKEDFRELTRDDQQMRDSGLDSLEYNILFLYLCDICDITDVVAEAAIPQDRHLVVLDMLEFFEQHSTVRDVETLERNFRKHF
jgi:hypothetical protein